MLTLLLDLNDPKIDTLLVRFTGVLFGAFNLLQRIKQAPMPKPDKSLRPRPMKEVEAILSKLKRVVLFHPDPIVEELPPQYCVCKKGETTKHGKEAQMIQCDECWEWFHFACVDIESDADVEDDEWKCEWCQSDVDKEGYQRWRSHRKKPKKRHSRDIPRLHGAQLGQNPPSRFSAPATWEGKVAEVKELSRRAAIKKRKLTEAAELLVVQEGHHLMDAEGMAGLEARAVDDGLVDEMLEAGYLDDVEMDDDM